MLFLSSGHSHFTVFLSLQVSDQENLWHPLEVSPREGRASRLLQVLHLSEFYTDSKQNSLVDDIEYNKLVGSLI